MGFHDAGEASPGKGKVEPGQDLEAGTNRIGRLGDLAGEFAENATDLLTYLQFGFFQLVVHFDHGFGFDEQRRARAGGVVNNSAHSSPGIGFYREDVSIIADGVIGIREVSADLRVAHIAVQSPLKIAREVNDVAPGGCEPVGGLVAHFTRRVDAAVDLPLETRVIPDRFGGFGEPGCAVLATAEEAGYVAQGFECAAHVRQFGDFENAALLRPGE